MSMKYVERASGTCFPIDLMMVRDDNRVVSIVGLSGPQLVPSAGDFVLASDEDQNTYRAMVETVLPDGRVYLRISWASKVRGLPLDDATTVYRSNVSVAQ